MQAVINLSGEGTRLRPLSCKKSGAMLDICGKSIAKRVIEGLVIRGVKSIVIMTGYMGDEIKEAFKDGEELGVNISYIPSTMSDVQLRQNAEILKEDFLYISKLVYTDFDIASAMRFHRERGSYITILTMMGVNEGIVASGSGRVTRIEEKRMWGSVFGESGCGMYIINSNVLKFMPDEGRISIAENVLPALLRAGKGIYAKRIEGECERVYDAASYMRANSVHLEMLKSYDKKGIVVSKSAVIDKGALLESPCYVGSGAHIHKGAKIGAYTSVGDNSVVLEGASLKRSIVGKGCRVGKNAALRGCIVDKGVQIGENTAIYEQAVVGENCKIGSNALIKSFVRIWPEKSVDKGMVVNENIMWGQKRRMRLFEEGRIKGTVNVDITPAFCALMGECVGAAFEGGSVGVSTDGTPAGIMIRDAVVSALTGSGCSVKDFGEQPLPITRRGTAFYMLDGAICVNVSDTSGEDVAEITIIGKHGFDIDEKMKERLEELFEKRDFIYPESRNIKECEYVFEYKIYYLKSIVNQRKASRRSKKLLLSCSAPWGRRLIASAMADFECSVSMYNPSVSDDLSGKRAFEEALRQGGFDLGLILDEKCESLTVCAPDLTIDEDLYEALTSLIVMKKYKGAKIYVPITASSAIDKLAEKYDCNVVRTKSAPVEIMQHMSGEERYLSEEFIFRFDAVGAAVLLMDYITGDRFDLRELIDEVPPINMAKTIIELPKSEISSALKRVCEMPFAKEDAEGIRISFDKGWVLVLPDMEKDALKLVSESAKAEIAMELCDICCKKIFSED